MSENRPLQSVLNRVILIPGITMVKFPIYIALRIFFLRLFTRSHLKPSRGGFEIASISYLLTWTVLQKVIGEYPGRSPFGRPHKRLNTRGVLNIEL